MLSLFGKCILLLTVITILLCNRKTFTMKCGEDGTLMDLVRREKVKVENSKVIKIKFEIETVSIQQMKNDRMKKKKKSL